VCEGERERETDRESIEPEKNYRGRRKERQSNLLCPSLSVRRMELSLCLLPGLPSITMNGISMD